MKTEECSCGNTGWLEAEVVENKQIAHKDTQTGKIYRSVIEVPLSVVIPCPHCSDQRELLFKSLHIPERYLQATLDNFETLDSPVLLKTKKKCLEYIENYPLLQDQNGLLFMGAPGVGKTHLAVAVMKRIVQNYHISAQFLDFRDLLASIRKSYSDQSYGGDEHILDQFRKVELLVIDELGSEQITSWVKEIVHRIIIPRYNNNMPTLFTTNYLDQVYYQSLPKQSDKSALPETLEDRIGLRLRSKLKEMCQLIPMVEKDYRSLISGETVQPQEEMSGLYKTIKKLRDQFSRLPANRKEGFYADAYKYNHTLALKYQEALATWIYCRNKNALPASLSIRQFLTIFKQIQTFNGK